MIDKRSIVAANVEIEAPCRGRALEGPAELHFVGTGVLAPAQNRAKIARRS